MNLWNLCPTASSAGQSVTVYLQLLVCVARAEAVCAGVTRLGTSALPVHVLGPLPAAVVAVSAGVVLCATTLRALADLTCTTCCLYRARLLTHKCRYSLANKLKYNLVHVRSDGACKPGCIVELLLRARPRLIVASVAGSTGLIAACTSSALYLSQNSTRKKSTKSI